MITLLSCIRILLAALVFSSTMPVRVASQHTPPITPGAQVLSYTSPIYGFALSWDPWWRVAGVTLLGGTETLILHDGLARATFVANRVFAGDVARCLDAYLAALVTSPEIAAVRTMRDEYGDPVGNRNGTEAYATVYIRAASASPATLEDVVFLKCWRLGDGDAVLALRFEARADAFAAEAPLMALLLDRLALPDGNPTIGSPNSASV